MTIAASSFRQPIPGGDPGGTSIAFGPVRSRRLGWSLGINNVPSKTCTYACVYCQVGATDRASRAPEAFFEPRVIAAAVQASLEACREAGQPVDYATFVPNGEPTLDLHLGEAIREVAALGVPVAILTNGSLAWDARTRDALAAADWVSLKIDTVVDETWHRLNRPVGGLELGSVLDGMRRFAEHFHGELATETMLVAGLNDDDISLDGTSAFVGAIEPTRAWVAVPTRPPAEPWVRAPAPGVVQRAVDRFRSTEVPTSLLDEDFDLPFAVVGADVAERLLGIVAVHPMTEAAARDYLARAGADWSVARDLIDAGRIVVVEHQGRTYLRGAPSTAHPRDQRRNG
jgi:wyosine [tRNA(Phe)-imidazoG37] synthetase (radical SAM superfamily)